MYDAGDDDERHVDRIVVPCASAVNCSANKSLVKDEELVLRFTNVECGPVELELCTEQGHVLSYFSRVYAAIRSGPPVQTGLTSGRRQSTLRSRV